MQEPLVTVLVSVYNHESYIEECLRSIAAQRVDFPIEVLVGEDCSTDGTRSVLRRLEPELPSYFTILYREKNMGSVANGEDLYSRARGKYLVDFEGDDFMLFDGRLQKQADFLESHPDYTAVSSNSLVVGADSRPNGEKYPECHDEEYSWKEYFYSCMPGQSGSIMCRAQDYFAARDHFVALKSYDSYPGDRRNAFLWLCMGRVRCFQEQWNAYRHIKKGGSSYSATTKVNESYARNEVLFGRALVEYADRYGTEDARRTARLTWYRLRLKWAFSKLGDERPGQVLHDLMGERGKVGLLLSPLRWYGVLGMRLLLGRGVTL